VQTPSSSPLQLLDVVPDAVLVVRRDGTIAYANRQAEQMFGYGRDELLRCDLETLIPQRFREGHLHHRAAYFGDPHVRPMGSGLELQGLRKDGSEFPAEISLSSIETAEGVHAVSTIRDVSERKRQEEALRAAQELGRVALDSLGSHVAVLDRYGKILHVNKAWVRFARENDAGSAASVRPGSNYLEICRAASERGSKDAELALTGILSVLSGSREVCEIEYPCHSPSEQRYFLMSVTAVQEPEKGALIAHSNITELKRAQLELEEAVAEIAELRDRLQAENVYLQEEIRSAHDFEDIVGDSVALKKVLNKVGQVAGTDATVLLLGETGTGKELIAHAIHARSGRKDHVLVKVNCAALPGTLIESELFGHEKGAFTGATGRRSGRFEVADGGTIFLDEIGDLALDLQAKLLRVLQDGEFERLGSTRTLKVDVRVIAATNRDLQAAVAEGSFRSDLFYRLTVFPIQIPPLRERREDIPLLVWHFITKRQAGLGKTIETVPRETMDRFVAYDWPGNARELQNVIERAIILAPGSTFRVDESFAPPADVSRVVSPIDSASLADMERAHVRRVLEESGWKVKGGGNAAERLGMNPSTLRSRMKKLGIARP
jgi:PAS domain S-box-containing protein